MAARNERLYSTAVLIVVVLGSFAWYYITASYDYATLAGLYVFDRNGERCLLDLRPDRSFKQELTRPDSVQRVKGTWYRYGASQVSFSYEFLRLSGQKLNAGGETQGRFEKRLGLFPVLTLAPLPDGPKFRKRLLR
jgi:hypothetical protein